MPNARVKMAKYVLVARTQKNPIAAAKTVENKTPASR